MSLLLGLAAAEPLAALECTAIRDLDRIFGMEEVVEELATTLPEHEELVTAFSMTSLTEGGIDIDGPLRITLHEEGDAKVSTMMFEVTDPAAFEDFATRAIDNRVDPETRVEFSIDGTAGQLRSWGQVDTNSMAAGYVDDLLDQAHEGDGCRFAVGMAGGSGLTKGRVDVGESGVLLQMFSERPDEMYMVVKAPSLGDDSPLISTRPARRPALHGDFEPDATVRMNVDVHSLVMGILGFIEASGAPLPDLKTPIEEAGFRFAPGLEVALVATGDSPRIVAAIPLRRPLRAQRIVRKLAREEGATRHGRLVALVVPASSQLLYVGARGRTLFVGNTPEDVEAARTRQGDVLVDHPWSQEPGLFFSVEAEELFKMMASRSGRPAPEDATAVTALISAEAQTVQFRVLVPGISAGFVEAATAGLLARMVVEPPPAVAYGGPVPEAPEAVLLDIRRGQLAYQAENDTSFAYLGGPRAVEELSAEAVPWEGIPALGVEAQDSACRYEVDSFGATWTARAICDEDGDGTQAVYIASSSQPPYALTGPDFR